MEEKAGGEKVRIGMVVRGYLSPPPFSLFPRPPISPSPSHPPILRPSASLRPFPPRPPQAPLFLFSLFSSMPSIYPKTVIPSDTPPPTIQTFRDRYYTNPWQVIRGNSVVMLEALERIGGGDRGGDRDRG